MAEKSAYNAASLEVCELFEDYLEGGPERATLVVSSSPLDEISRNALFKSMSALGFGEEACTFATLSGRNSLVEGQGVVLDSDALFLLIEGIDPLFIVSTDEAATSVLRKSYRSDIKGDSATRIFGRSSVAFYELSALLGDQVGKRKVWELLKELC